MPDIYRPSVPVGACTTLFEKSIELGGSAVMLRHHKRRKTAGFPSPVARFGAAILYVDAELDAFYKSIQWKQADRSIKELTGDISWETS